MADKLYANLVLKIIRSRPKEKSLVDGKTKLGPVRNTRLGPVRLTYRDMRKVNLESLQDVIVDPNKGPDLEENFVTECRFELKMAVYKWWLALYNLCLKRGATTEQAEQGRIKFNSFFRHLGKNMGDDKDPYGVVDSTDDWGHWNGYAADISRLATGDSFKPVIDRYTVTEVALALGIERSQYNEENKIGEFWHFNVKTGFAPDLDNVKVKYEFEKWKIPAWWPPG